MSLVISGAPRAALLMTTLLLLPALLLAPSTSPAAEGQELTLLFHAGVHGEILDCGCKAKPLGGLARRAALVEEIRGTGGDVLLLDAGNLLGQNRPEDLAQTDFLLGETARLGYAAMGVGPWDLGRGIEYLREAEREHGLRFVSANLRRGDEPLFPPYVIVEAGGLRIGVISVLDEAFKDTRWTEGVEGLQIGCARCALKSVLPALRAEVDLVVLHSNMKDSAALLTELGPQAGIDVAIEGWENTRSPQPRRVGDTLLVAANGAGKYLGQLDLVVREGAVADARLMLHELELKLPEQPEVAARVRDFQQQQAELARGR